MTKVDHWLLPEGIEEILPNQAFAVERLRRQLLDVYHGWGYDLVIPPLVEFTDSLLSGSGRDLDLLTFKLTDQLSGKTMGVSADITPQTARMDAHSLRRTGPNRLCYAGTVLYTRPRSPISSRSPIHVGVELYGVPSLEADLEVISLMAEALADVGVAKLCLDLGHVGIYRSIEESLDIDSGLKAELFELLQAKSCELDSWVASYIADTDLAAIIKTLPKLSGDSGILDSARELFAGAPAEVELALDELQLVVEQLNTRYPDLEIYLDLCELEGYHYHTGIVFAAYADAARQALANGGRYDDIGESFGRARPATGFSIDLKAVVDLVTGNEDQGYNQPSGIYAEASENPAQVEFIRDLRANGDRVVCGFSGQSPDYAELRCDRILVADGGHFSVKPIIN
ncbi:MAG: ATP phosphoribosyltransferase regulatory subunit [Porticoccaceae bacterium]